MRLYVAAPLFTEAERAFNLVLARALEAAGHDVYLPQRDRGRRRRGAAHDCRRHAAGYRTRRSAADVPFVGLGVCGF